MAWHDVGTAEMQGRGDLVARVPACRTSAPRQHDSIKRAHMNVHSHAVKEPVGDDKRFDGTTTTSILSCRGPGQAVPGRTNQANSF